MKRIFLILIFCNFFAGILHAQKITGKVSDQNGEPLAGANVTILHSFMGTSTDKDGSFELPSKTGKQTLVISFIGYKTQKKEINVVKDEMNIGTISLEPERFLTEEVTVRATRAGENVPIAFTQIDGEELQKRNFARDIPYLLTMTPSLVATSEAGTGIGYTNFRIRGTDPTRINVTINGIPLNDSESQTVFWVNMPDFASSVSNVQIQRGVGTSTHGAAAFGASVNFQTITSSPEPYAQISLTGGSFNTFRQNVMAGTGILDSGFSFDVRLSNLYSDGYVRNSFSDHQSFMITGAWHGKNSFVRANLISGKEKTGISWWGCPAEKLEEDRRYNPAGAYTDAYGNQQYYENQTDNYKQTHFQLLYSANINNNLNFNSAFHYTRGDGYYEQYRQNQRLANYGLSPIEIPVDPIIVGTDTIPNNPVIINNSDLIRRRMMGNDFYGTTISLNYEKGRLDATLGTGINYYEGDHFGNIIWMRYAGKTEIDHEWYNNTGFKTDANAFVKVNYELLDGLYTFGDIQYRRINYRMEGIDIDIMPDGTQKIMDQEHIFNFVNPKAGLFYNLNNNMDLYFSFAIANREPTRTHFKEATGDPDNTPLPEQLFNYELGYVFKSYNYSAGINLYYMDYKDQLIPTGERSSVGYDIMTNVAESYRRGIEITGAAKIADFLRIDGNLTLSQNRIKNFTTWASFYDENWNEEDYRELQLGETNIAYSPAIIGGLRIVYTPFTNFNISVFNHYIGAQYFDNTSSKDRMLDPYFVNNLQIDYTFSTELIKEIELKFSVNNFTNQLYSNNAYGGMYYYNGAEQTWAYYFPQAGINFLGGISLRF